MIDEVGYLSYSNRHADLMFELISRRYQNKSTLVTTNRPFAEWREVFPNAACVVSLVDRLLHNAEIVSIEGDSYRLKEARERTEQRARQRRAASHERVRSNAPRICVRSPSRSPATWTPEEALAVFELIDDLRDKIWRSTAIKLRELLQSAARTLIRRRGDAGTTIDRSEPPDSRPTRPDTAATDPNNHPVVRSRRPSRRPDLRAPKPSRAAAVKEARRAPRRRREASWTAASTTASSTGRDDH